MFIGLKIRLKYISQFQMTKKNILISQFKSNLMGEGVIWSSTNNQLNLVQISYSSPSKLRLIYLIQHSVKNCFVFLENLKHLKIQREQIYYVIMITKWMTKVMDKLQRILKNHLI